MKTFFAITAIVLASLWVLRFIIHFMYLVEKFNDDDDMSRISIYIQESWFNGKILSWQTFWILVIRGFFVYKFNPTNYHLLQPCLQAYQINEYLPNYALPAIFQQLNPLATLPNRFYLQNR